MKGGKCCQKNNVNLMDGSSGATWDRGNTTDRQKMLRLKVHIQYAAEKGVLDLIEKFIKDLKRDQWLILWRRSNCILFDKSRV
jgi:hypothetical protein